MTRFELAASSSRTKRATGLRYIPNRFALQNYTFFNYGEQLFLKNKENLLFEGMSYRTERPIDTLPRSSVGMTWAA